MDCNLKSSRLAFMQPNSRYTVFITVWLLGFFCGAVSAGYAEDICFSMMRTAFSTCVSIPCLLMASVLPVLFVVLTISFSYWWLLLPVTFAESLSFGFCGSLISLTYGSAAWLVKLLMLPNIFLLPVSCWFVLRNLQQKQIRWKRDAAIAIGIAGIVAAVYYFVMIPLMGRL